MFQNSSVSEEEDDDDWFYNSIQRYDDLLMYEFQGKVSSVAFESPEKLITTCFNTNGRQEIMRLTVPERLLAEKDAGIVKNRDFVVKAAGYLKSEASSVISVQNILLTSEIDGVHKYKLPCLKNSDLILHYQLIRNLVNLQINYDYINELSCGSNLGNVKTYSVEHEREIRDYSHMLSGKNVDKDYSLSYIGTLFNNFVIGCRDTGLCFNVDRRSKFPSRIKIPESEDCTWAYDSSPEGIIALLNSLGFIYIFDYRNTSKEIMKIEFQFDTWEDEIPLEVHLDPFNSFVSVSSFDKSVKIFSLDANVENSLKFTHDGHKKNCRYVTGHKWHPTLKNVIFSYDNKGVMQAWKFR